MAETLGEHHEFDWVQAMSSCTVEKVFECLKKEVEGDLEKLQSCNPERARGLVYEPSKDEKTFSIKYNTNPYGMYFVLSGSTIVVERYTAKSDIEPIMKLSVELNDEGECMLVDGEGKSWLRWQVRRQALEGIFFGAGQ